MNCERTTESIFSRSILLFRCAKSQFSMPVTAIHGILIGVAMLVVFTVVIFFVLHGMKRTITADSGKIIIPQLWWLQYKNMPITIVIDPSVREPEMVVLKFFEVFGKKMEQVMAYGESARGVFCYGKQGFAHLVALLISAVTYVNVFGEAINVTSTIGEFVDALSKGNSKGRWLGVILDKILASPQIDFSALDRISTQVMDNVAPAGATSNDAYNDPAASAGSQQTDNGDVNPEAGQTGHDDVNPEAGLQYLLPTVGSDEVDPPLTELHTDPVLAVAPQLVANIDDNYDENSPTTVYDNTIGVSEPVSEDAPTDRNISTASPAGTIETGPPEFFIPSQQDIEYAIDAQAGIASQVGLAAAFPDTQDIAEAEYAAAAEGAVSEAEYVAAVEYTTAAGAMYGFNAGTASAITEIQEMREEQSYDEEPPVSSQQMVPMQQVDSQQVVPMQQVDSQQVVPMQRVYDLPQLVVDSQLVEIQQASELPQLVVDQTSIEIQQAQIDDRSDPVGVSEQSQVPPAQTGSASLSSLFPQPFASGPRGSQPGLPLYQQIANNMAANFGITFAGISGFRAGPSGGTVSSRRRGGVDPKSMYLSQQQLPDASGSRYMQKSSRSLLRGGKDLSTFSHYSAVIPTAKHIGDSFGSGLLDPVSAQREIGLVPNFPSFGRPGLDREVITETR